MSTVDSLPPDFSEADAVRITREYYGLRATSGRLSGYSNQNFHITDSSGKEYILKISNPSERESILEAQNLAMKHITDHSTVVDCPGVLPSVSGRYIESVPGKDNKTYRVRLLTFINGNFFSEVISPAPSLLHSLGILLGNLDKTLNNFYHPAADRYWIWDLKNANDIIHYTKFIDNPSRRSMVEYFLMQFDTSVLPVLPKLRSSVIHNDANDNNILVRKADNGEKKVVGIIDFGDLVYTYTICELAIALAYVMFNKKEPIEAALPVIQGYHKIFPVTEKELEVLFYLICTRLCTSVTLSAHQKTLQPDNEYITISEKPAWALLEKLQKINPFKALSIFSKTCKMNSGIQYGKTRREILKERETYIGRSLSIAYREHLNIIRGAMQYLYDNTGNTYLDCINNVCHVGHCHPHVASAAQKQIPVLNTNTRYLHENMVLYAKRLISRMPEPLKVCFFVNSGSEANELALRMAYTHTQQKDCIVVDNAYHGNTSSLIELSPYKFDGPGGTGSKPFIHKVIMPDVYRGLYKSNDTKAGEKYAGYILQAITNIHNQGKGLAAFFCESLMGCGGQIVLPENYLKTAYKFVKEAGGICVADEIQVGFGRVGTHFWGFETQGVIPDIVTLGKPIGNGHPLGAVITTPEIARSFDNGMEYFNTFGGNPVSCAVGLAVLDVIENEKLQENALKVGNYLLSGLNELKSKYSLIGDVRGLGLFIGIELVSDRATLEPAAKQASYIVEALKERGILISIDGPLYNVLKIKPPLVFTKENADQVVDSLDMVLGNLI
jgi:4-aminobutyrate aminotransferase-like enzyme/Ser/Thr protein kinase RdoA (MazF antagonist)